MKRHGSRRKSLKKRGTHGGSRSGSGRKATGKIRVCVTLPPDLVDRVDAVVKASGSNRSDFVARAVEKEVDKHKET